MDFGGRFLKINLYRNLVQLVLFLMLGMLVRQGFIRVETTHWSLKANSGLQLENCTRSILVFFFSVVL